MHAVEVAATAAKTANRTTPRRTEAVRTIPPGLKRGTWPTLDAERSGWENAVNLNLWPTPHKIPGLNKPRVLRSTQWSDGLCITVVWTTGEPSLVQLHAPLLTRARVRLRPEVPHG